MSFPPLCDQVIVRDTTSVPAARCSEEHIARLDHGLAVCTLLPAFDIRLTEVSCAWLDSLLLHRPMVSPFPDRVACWGTQPSPEGFEHGVPHPLTGSVIELIVTLGGLVQGLAPMARGRGPARPHQYRDDESAAGPLDDLGIGGR